MLDGVDLDAVIARTEGVTAPFLKELLRKAALLAADGDGPDGAEGEVIRVRDEHITTALDQLLAVRGQLTRVLLGGRAQVPAASAS